MRASKIKSIGITLWILPSNLFAAENMQRYDQPNHGYSVEFPKRCSVKQNVQPDKDFSVACYGNPLALRVLAIYTNIDVFRRNLKSNMVNMGATDYQDKGLKTFHGDGPIIVRALQSMSLKGSRLQTIEYSFKIGPQNYLLICEEGEKGTECDQIAKTIRHEPTAEKMIRHGNSEHGYSIEFPSDSTVERGNRSGIDFSVRESNPRLGLTVIAREFKEPLSLEVFLDSMYKSFKAGVVKQGYTDFRKAGEGHWQTNGIDVVWRAAVFKMDGIPAEHLYYVFKQVPRYFVISCSGNTDIQPRCDQIARSVRLEPVRLEP